MQTNSFEKTEKNAFITKHLACLRRSSQVTPSENISIKHIKFSRLELRASIRKLGNRMNEEIVRSLFFVT